jgi:hypothetical protein
MQPDYIELLGRTIAHLHHVAAVGTVIDRHQQTSASVNRTSDC